MSKTGRKDMAGSRTIEPSMEEFHVVALKLLEQANKGVITSRFLEESTGILLNVSGCDVVGIYIADDPVNCYGESSAKPSDSYKFYATKPGFNDVGRTSDNTAVIHPDFISVMFSGDDVKGGIRTPRGSFFTLDVIELLKELNPGSEDPIRDVETSISNFRSLALIPITANNRNIGILKLKRAKANAFGTKDITFFEYISDILGTALVSHSAQIALGERIKELSCLYRIAQIAAEPGYTLDDVMHNVVDILPRAWQFPEITEGRIVLDGQDYSTSGFTGNLQNQTSDIYIDGKRRGIIEVAYKEVMPDLDEGPFLREERNLIDAIARLIAQIIERKQAEEDRAKLQNQLRHADRLATIGQLAAGVAHEFNEPLGNVLGFAQLILKNENLPQEVQDDIGKIITASMHAREVVKKLMLFARQMPAERSNVQLNKVIEDGLYFLDARCKKAGIDLVRSLDPALPEILADQSQMHQVLVNLVVNAIQAMPDGGTLTISTDLNGELVSLKVVDTGEGIDEEAMEKLFVPFFTTKDVDEGTGLGLPVVHGIVTSHGGSIKVTSEVGKGSCFEIILPITGPATSKV